MVFEHDGSVGRFDRVGGGGEAARGRPVGFLLGLERAVFVFVVVRVEEGGGGGGVGGGVEGGVLGGEGAVGAGGA